MTALGSSEHEDESRRYRSLISRQRSRKSEFRILASRSSHKLYVLDLQLCENPRRCSPHTPRIPGTRRPQNVQELRQLHLRSANPTNRIRTKIHSHGHRSGAQAPHRPRQSRRLPRVRLAQIVFAAGNAGMVRGRLPHRGNRLHRVQNGHGRQSDQVDRAGRARREEYAAHPTKYCAFSTTVP